MNAVRFGALLLALAALAAPARGQEFLGKPLEGWLEDLGQQKSAGQRRSAAFALGKIGLDSPKQGLAAVVPLQERLDDADAGVREAAAFAIGEIFGKARQYKEQTLDRLCRLLREDDDPLVRRSAAFALGNTGQAGKSVVAALNTAAADKHAAVRQNVAWALGRMGDQSVKSLRKLLRDDDEIVKRDAAVAVQALGADAGAEAVPELVRCAAHSDVELRKAALAALVGVLSPDDADAATSVLLKGLKDPQVEIRQNAALALGQVGGPSAFTALKELRLALRPESDIGLRRRAALALGGLRDALTSNGGKEPKDQKDYIPELHKALKDPDEELRKNAAVACVRLGPAAHPYVPDLVALLTDRKDEPKVRAQAAVALSRIGYVPALQQAMPTLLKLFVDQSEGPLVRERTLWPVRLYLKNSDDREPVYKALASILEEERNDSVKMLHYDCAYLLGMFQQEKVPDKVLDVLEAFLRDETIKLYAGVKGATSGVVEKGGGATGSKEEGKDDGRVMAVDALGQIGRTRVTARPTIVAQLRTLAMSADTNRVLKERVQEVLQLWKVK